MKPWVRKIEDILGNALEDGRDRLFEHEVYRILSILSIRVPVHQYIQHEEEITNENLSRFRSSKIVLKEVKG